MYQKFKYCLLLFIILNWVACGTGVENQDLPPSPVKLVEKSAEDAVEEKGIDAEAIPGPEGDIAGNGIVLQWYALQEEDIAGYNVYRSETDSLRDFIRIAQVEDTFYLDKAVQPNQKFYYYYVTAVDQAGQEGEPSEVGKYALIPWADLVYPIRDTEFNGQGGTFAWDFSSGFPVTFVFRLEREIQPNIYVNFFTKHIVNITDYDVNQEWSLSRLAEEGLSTPLPTGRYRWRIDNLGSEAYQGSESLWEFFVVK